MKLIGKGLQYRVYDIGGGRVRKFETSYTQKFLTLFVWYFATKDIFRIPEDIRDSFQITNNSISWLKQHMDIIPNAILGNVKYLEGNDYEQDKVQPLIEYFNSHSDEENIQIMEAYASLILLCWGRGFSDIVFNYLVNAGVSNTGAVVLIDIGEISHNKDEVKKIVAEKKWLTQSSYSQFTKKSLKPAIKEIFDKKFTIETLEKNWPKT